MLQPSQRLTLTVERPASGGRMIARHDGQVVLVAGAIPGETVTARVERVDKRVAFAVAEQIESASADRRDVPFDAACGGCLYAHIAYARQLEIKAAVIADAFARIGRLPLDRVVPVSASPEDGYRMRARLHVRDGRAGFYREGTHDICDAGPTRQLLPASLDSIAALVKGLSARAVTTASIELSETIAGDRRAAHVDLGGDASAPDDLEGLVHAAALSGCTVRTARGRLLSAGEPFIADPVAALTGNPSAAGVLSRQPTSFFQANRYAIPALVRAVITAVPPGGPVLDLYAGVGLFSIALAASGRDRITAIEGDRSSGADLERNAAAWAGALTAIVGPVEQHVVARQGHREPDTTIVIDPPRTGVSQEAMRALLGQRAPRVVYVSCDPPTLARDARHLADAGYRLGSIEGLDLFPNTPHVETVAVFDR